MTSYVVAVVLPPRCSANVNELVWVVQLSKIIKHLQAQLDQQEEEGAQLKDQLAAAHEQVELLQDATAGHPEALEQVCCFSRTVADWCWSKYHWVTIRTMYDRQPFLTVAWTTMAASLPTNAVNGTASDTVSSIMTWIRQRL